MENRINLKLLAVKAENRPALVPYLTVGYPTIKLSDEIALKALRSGADMLELGIPFSDPIADGPTIQKLVSRLLKTVLAFQCVWMF